MFRNRKSAGWCLTAAAVAVAGVGCGGGSGDGWSRAEVARAIASTTEKDTPRYRARVTCVDAGAISGSAFECIIFLRWAETGAAAGRIGVLATCNPERCVWRPS